jgi:hypothetical protein
MQIKNRQQMLILTALAGLALLVGDSLIFSPLVKAWKSRSEKIVELRKQVEKGERLVRYEDSYRATWAQMQTNTLPRNPSLAEQQVLQAFDKWSQDSRISVNSITPQWKRDSEEFTTLQCRVDASGTIGTLSRFLYNVEQDPMALKIESVEIAARDKEGAQLSMGLQISGLVLNLAEEKR